MPDEITHIPTDHIEYHPQYVPQVGHDKKEKERLDEERKATWLSVKKVGAVKEPIHVQPASAGKYLILNGGDRYEGAKKAKLKTIPAIVHPQKWSSTSDAISCTRLIMRGKLTDTHIT